MEIRTADGSAQFRATTGYEANMPVFFSDNYKNYITYHKSSNKRFLLLYSNDYVMPVLIRHYYIFKSVEFEYSPVRYHMGNESQKDFLDEVCLFLKRHLGIQWLLPTPPCALFEAYPTHAKTIKFANTAVDLNRDEETVYSSLSHSFKKEVKRALKNGVVGKVGKKEYIQDFAKMEAATWKRSGNNVSHINDSYYEDIVKNMGDNVIISMVYKDGEPQAGELSFVDNDTCFGMFAARADGMVEGSNRYSHWQTMQWCLRNGIKKYVIVGYRLKVDPDSKIARIQHFKDSLNGVHEEGFMFKMVFKNSYVKLYGLILSLYGFIRTGKLRKEKGADIISQEIHKWPEYNSDASSLGGGKNRYVNAADNNYKLIKAA